MSVPEYTVRMTSHKCDRDARRALITAICGREPAAIQAAATRTRLLYEGVAAVNLIDCDYDVLDEKLTDHDIIYFDFSKTVPKYKQLWFQTTHSLIGAHNNSVSSYDGLDDQSEYKYQWMQKILEGTTTVVWTNVPTFTSCPVRLQNLHPMYKDAPATTLTPIKLVSIPGSNESPGKLSWWTFIQDKFGIRGLQAVETMMEPMNVGHTLINSHQSSIRGLPTDIPWPIPEISMILPTYVKVEEIRHDLATNAIIIRFG